MNPKRRAQIRRWKGTQKGAAGAEAFICFVIAAVILIMYPGYGRLLAIIPALFVIIDGREAVLGNPKPWRRRFDPLWDRERHIPDCPHCCRGGVPKPMLQSFFAYERDTQCPYCLGAGKVRHPDNEWYYQRQEAKLAAEGRYHAKV